MPSPFHTILIITALLTHHSLQADLDRSISESFEQPKEVKTFHEETFRCVMGVAYQRLLEGADDWKPDAYSRKLVSFLNNEKIPNLLTNVSNIKLQKDFNHLMINFDLYKNLYKEAIKKCDLSVVLENTKGRCYEKYGETNCMKTNAVSYGKRCPEGYTNYKNYFCFPKCPEGFKEEKTYCLKGNHKKVGLLETCLSGDVIMFHYIYVYLCLYRVMSLCMRGKFDIYLDGDFDLFMYLIWWLLRYRFCNIGDFEILFFDLLQSYSDSLISLNWPFLSC